jgi:hypothetical protein
MLFASLVYNRLVLSHLTVVHQAQLDPGRHGVHQLQHEGLGQGSPTAF